MRGSQSQKNNFFKIELAHTDIHPQKYFKNLWEKIKILAVWETRTEIYKGFPNFIKEKYFSVYFQCFPPKALP